MARMRISLRRPLSDRSSTTEYFLSRVNAERPDAGRPEPVRPPEFRGSWFRQIQGRNIYAELCQLAQMMSDLLTVFMQWELGIGLTIRLTSGERNPDSAENQPGSRDHRPLSAPVLHLPVEPLLEDAAPLPCRSPARLDQGSQQPLVPAFDRAALLPPCRRVIAGTNTSP